MDVDRYPWHEPDTYGWDGQHYGGHEHDGLARHVHRYDGAVVYHPVVIVERPPD